MTGSRWSASSTPPTLDEYYDRADVFVLATLQETYGMAVR